MITKNESEPLITSYGLKEASPGPSLCASSLIKDLILESNRREVEISRLEKRYNRLKSKNNNENEHELNVLAKVLFKLSRQKDEITTKIIILQYQQQTDSYQKSAQTENLFLEQGVQMDKLNGQIDTVMKTFIDVHRKLKTRIKNNKPKGDKNKEKFKYLTEIAVKIASDYSKNNPHKLSKDNCAHGVTLRIKDAFLDHFDQFDPDGKEKRKANIDGIPNKNTVDSHVTNAFISLGYPSFKEAQKRNKPKA